MGSSCIKYIDIYNACTLQKAHQQELHGVHEEEVVLQNLHLSKTRKILEKIFQCCHGNILSHQL